MFRALTISLNEIRASSSIVAWPSHVHPTLLHCFFFFFTLPPLSKCFISQTENLSFTGKRKLLKQQMAGLQIAAQREFLSRIVREWRVPWRRTESRRRKLCLLRSSREMLWNKHLFSYSCEFLHSPVRLTLLFFEDAVCSFVRQVLQWIFRGSNPRLKYPRTFTSTELHLSCDRLSRN